MYVIVYNNKFNYKENKREQILIEIEAYNNL